MESIWNLRNYLHALVKSFLIVCIYVRLQFFFLSLRSPSGSQGLGCCVVTSCEWVYIFPRCRVDILLLGGLGIPVARRAGFVDVEEMGAEALCLL